MTSNGEYENEPRPRLCHLRRWPNFVGYGFNLHCEKSKPGQYIGKVDPDSPAESAGLKEYDRIVEVNFVPIGNENHKQVVSRIKEGVSRNGIKYPEEVILLVLDRDADAYYKNKSIVVRGSDANVERRETEVRDGKGNDEQSPRSSERSIENDDSPALRDKSLRTATTEHVREYKHVTDFTGPTVTHTTKTDGSPAISRTSDHEHYLQSSPLLTDRDKRKEFTPVGSSSPASPTKDSRVKSTGTEGSRHSPSQSSSTNGSEGAMELKMSAAEYREKLKAQQARKRDSRQDQQLSMKQKHDLIDRL